MSVQTEVLYGNRLFGTVTYSDNNDPETLNLSLSDSVPMLDAQMVPLIDSVALSESRVASLDKLLADSITMSDSPALSALIPLADLLAVSDLSVTVLQTRGLTDFIVLNEWLSIDLIRAEIWTITSAELTPNGELTEFGDRLYSEPLYSSQPVTSWVTATDDATEWTSTADVEHPLPLFGQVLYGQPLYAGVPQSTWLIPPTDAVENFTNFDGEGNVP